uniref:NADH-ubiquinone oxidoreductase chain 3 n=1 Tax=Salpa thompsoni TaxID=569448 RepID=A0A2Z5U2X1_9UROC|nr:NADH dehydrogenase subunit 3 [Salpa thompsoni]
MLTYTCLGMILMVVFWVLLQAVTFNVNSKEYSMFECGFESSTGLVSYSLQFFTLALSFIAFDFEIFLLLPFMSLFFHFSYGILLMLAIVGMLTLLLYVELKYMTQPDMW